ncbi:MAG: type II toxin-antitoxin system Phd/YefM family antitoxin [Acidiferrobacterales bacterium]
MSKVNIHDAKTHLSRYLEEASQGREIAIIAKAGKPVARIAPLTATKVVCKLGLLNGNVRILDDFNTPLPDKVLAEFLGGE